MPQLFRDCAVFCEKTNRPPSREAVRRLPWRTWAVIVATVGGFAGTPVLSAPPTKIEFNRDIRPILSNSCFTCHGPDSAKREAGLRLDRRGEAVKTAESGETAIVPGDAVASEMIQRLVTASADLRMPPENSGKVVTPEQVELLKQWIDEGAEYQDHWAFRPIVRPEVSQDADPSARNPIDRFVHAKAREVGLAPAIEADRVTLIRRLSLDLTGLPPTPAEVDAFVADAAPDAYETLVDRLLASPRYGEHMARYWLDAARYGDTHGLHLDNERSIWPYREWVIEAFNRNQSFDQFTIDQLAGDLLPAPTIPQKVATGFNRCNVTTSEGGAIDAEFYVRYAVDRTETVGTVWMGLTLGCAACHDHKFDPVSQKEFYSLYAFFNSLSDKAMDGNALLPPPTLQLPTADQTARLAELAKQIELAKAEYNRQAAGIMISEPDPDAAVSALDVSRRDYLWFEDQPPAGANLQANTGGWKYVKQGEGPVHAGEVSTVRTSTGLDQHFFTGATESLNIGRGDHFFAYVYLDPQNLPESIMLQFNDGDWSHRMYWGADKIPYGSPNKPEHRHGGDLPPAGQWVRLEVDAQHVGLAPGSKVNGIAFTQFGGTVYWDGAGLVTLTPQAGESFRSQQAWESYARRQDLKTLPDDVKKALAANEKANDEQKKTIRQYFVTSIHPESRKILEPLKANLDRLQTESNAVQAQVAVTLVSEDLAQPRDAFVLIRGAYDKPGEKVERATPAFLPPMGDLPKNRLGLARWLVSGQHPLTARVIMNRFWNQYFGQGLVKTPADFGSQSEWPTQPELLDWLAAEFMSSGWDMKYMHRLIVTSATYRQSSKVGHEAYARDPENRYLTRGPRFRLDAESIRDQALYVAGLLVEREGGKSVKTYQPDGVWESVGFVGSNTRTYRRDSGDSLFRRSLYTFWKRTSPPPALLTFDAPSRETCTVQRPRTNTPLQALVLMNDEQYVEAARGLAARAMSEGGSTPRERLSHAFRWVTSRAPRDTELVVLERAWRKQVEIYQDAAAADQLLAVGTVPRPGNMDPRELAAYTMVANLLLNLDETITKE